MTGCCFYLTGKQYPEYVKSGSLFGFVTVCLVWVVVRLAGQKSVWLRAVVCLSAEDEDEVLLEYGWYQAVVE